MAAEWDEQGPAGQHQGTNLGRRNRRTDRHVAKRLLPHTPAHVLLLRPPAHEQELEWLPGQLLRGIQRHVQPLSDAEVAEVTDTESSILRRWLKWKLDELVECAIGQMDRPRRPRHVVDVATEWLRR